jgi:hypothetical protein
VMEDSYYLGNKTEGEGVMEQVSEPLGART